MPQSSVNFLQTLSLSKVRCEEHDEVCNFICLDKQCQKHGIHCAICSGESHKDHLIKPFKFFLNQLVQSVSSKITLISAEIDVVSEGIKNEFRKVNNKQDREQLEKTFDSYIKEIRSKIHKEFLIQKELREFFEHGQNLNLKKINAFVSKYQLHEYELEVQPPKPLTNQEKFMYQILQLLKQKKQDYLALLKAKSDIKDILGLFIFCETKERVTFAFSEELKHTAIKITDKITAKQEHNYSSNFALIEPMICGKKKTMDKKTVKIKIDKLNSWVNLGVCVKSKVVSANYYFNTEDIGHGAYTISNDGYSWHNTETSSNSYYHGWSFNQGDIVTMTFDPKTKSIKYSKENNDKEHELPCQPIVGEEMYFCVTLNTHDECVSLVQ